MGKKKQVTTVKVRGAKYTKALKICDKDKLYSFKEAITTLKKIAFEKFDSSVEVHLNLEKPALKGEITFPHGIGKKIRVAIFDAQIEAKIVAKNFDFDVLLASAKDMPKLVKYARVLGPKGLMPSPKRGTLVDDLVKAKQKFETGSIQYRSEVKFPIMHQVIGKISFTEKQLLENLQALFNEIQVKNILNGFIKTSMSPSIKLDFKKG